MMEGEIGASPCFSVGRALLFTTPSPTAGTGLRARVGWRDFPSLTTGLYLSLLICF